MKNLSIKDNKRIIYIDLLRVISIFAVVVLHVASSNWTIIDVNLPQWQVLNIFDSAVRWCVPVFFMISGMFLLNPEKDIKIREIYTKYVFRIITALIVTSMFYIVYLAILEGVKMDLLFWVNAVESVVQGKVRYHLWFLYVIIGLYIVTPVLRVFIKAANKKDIEYFILIAVIFSVITPLLLRFYPFNELLVSFNKLNVNIMIQYSLYYVSGYYFANNSLEKKTRYMLYLFSGGALMFTILATYVVSINKGIGYTVFYEYLTPNVMVMSFGVFIFFKEYVGRIEFSNDMIEKIKLLSALSFVIYLVHDAVRVSFESIGIDSLTMNPIIGVPIVSVLIYFVSFLIAYLLRKTNEMMVKIIENKKNIEIRQYYNIFM